MVAEVASIWTFYVFLAIPVVITVAILLVFRRYYTAWIVPCTAICLVLSSAATWLLSGATYYSLFAVDLVLAAAYGAILGAIFCFLAAPPLAGRPILLGPWATPIAGALSLARVAATAALLLAAIGVAPLSILAADNGSIPLPQQGFEAIGGGMRPTSGRWLGFAQGQARGDAAANACSLIARGELKAIARDGFPALKCPAQTEATATPAYEETWYFAIKPHFRCVGVAPETLGVSLTASGQVSDIRVDCGDILPPL
jgi:hypothetical protein